MTKEEMEVQMQKYDLFVESVCDFTVTVMGLFHKQKEMNAALYEDILAHHNLLKVHQNCLKEYIKSARATKQLLTDHEERIMRVEQTIKQGYGGKLIKDHGKPN